MIRGILFSNQSRDKKPQTTHQRTNPAANNTSKAPCNWMTRRRLILILLAVLLVGGLALLFIGPKEPTYKGKTLTEWIFYWPPQALEKREAILAIGTNALPTLLKLVSARDGAIKGKLAKFLNQQNLVNIHIHTAYEKHAAAFYAYQTLSDKYANANSNVFVLPLIKLTRHADSEVRLCALLCLHWMTKFPYQVEYQKALAECLKDSDPDVRSQAAYEVRGPGIGILTIEIAAGQTAAMHGYYPTYDYLQKDAPWSRPPK